MTAFSTARVGSIWKPPIPAGVRKRMSSGRMALRYDVNGAMTGKLQSEPVRPSSEEGHNNEPCLEAGFAGEDTFGRERSARSIQAVHRHVCGEGACRDLACNETSRGSSPGHERACFDLASARSVFALVRRPRLDCARIPARASGKGACRPFGA